VNEVFVVLSSYNGARYIGEQIESIRRQTFTEWKLLVRDDGSSDETIRIVEALASSDPRIELVRDGRGNLQTVASFGALLERAMAAGAGYVALADQDDVWQPRKLSDQLTVLRERESAIGTGTPLLVHSDLAVVAEDLSVIQPSSLDFRGHETEFPLGRLVVQNYVTGCTVLVNRALLQTALPFPKIIMHDWWLALCAAALGEVLCLPQPTVLYRQHGRNTVGFRGRRQACLETVLQPLTWWSRSGSLFSRVVAQARELAHRVEQSHQVSAPSPSLFALQEFSTAFNGHGVSLQRLRVVRRYGFRPRSLLPYPVWFYARVLMWSGSAAGSSRQADSTFPSSVPLGQGRRSSGPAAGKSTSPAGEPLR
jgi:rhamnosyltransferase